jgi:hypothetical protein
VLQKWIGKACQSTGWVIVLWRRIKSAARSETDIIVLRGCGPAKA